MTKTNMEIINFINFARDYMKEHEKPTKFRYALERMEKRALKVHETYAEGIAEANIENAATDKDGAILTDEKGNFRYTKDGIRKRNQEHRALLEKAVEIEPYMATEVPDDLSAQAKQVCGGFVIPAEPAAPEEEPQ